MRSGNALAAGHHGRRLDHRRRAAQVGAPAAQFPEVLLDGVGDQTAALRLRVGSRSHDDVHVQARVLPLQLLEPGHPVDVAWRTHTEVEMNGVLHALRDRAAQDRQDRRQARAAGDTEHRAFVLASQVGRAERPADLNRVAEFELVRDVAGHAPVGNPANVELEQAMSAQPGHRIRPHMLGRELQLHVLAWRELHGFGRAQHQTLDVVGHVFEGDDRRLDDARRVHDDFVGLGDLDRAGPGDVGLAGEHEVLVAVGRLCGSPAPSNTSPSSTRQRQVPQRPAMHE